MSFQAYEINDIEVETLLQKGLKLVYYRVDDKMRIGFDHLESLITSKSRAIYAIHYIGFPQPVKRLSDLAFKYNLKFIEDCALSLFSSSPEGPLGKTGDISIYCLYKTLPAPHGGLLVLNNPDWISTTTILANRLLDSLDTKWDGWGYKLNNTLFN